MKMKKLFRGMEVLFNKASQTESKYQEALEKKQLELVELQAKLQDQLFMLKDLHKMKLLGDVSEATYEAEAEKVQHLQKQVQELQKEINLIEVYQTEDIKAVIEELDAEKRKVLQSIKGK
jgi:Skp family chaperone for outer membrane proteins